MVVQSGPMTEKELSLTDIEATLSEKDRQSVKVLRLLNEAPWFAHRDGKVCLYMTGGYGSPYEKFEVEEFFEAVDYYYRNRVSESQVSAQMKKQDGKIDIYTPFNQGEERFVLVSIKNHLVPQILEFAYLLARQELNKSK